MRKILGVWLAAVLLALPAGRCRAEEARPAGAEGSGFDGTIVAVGDSLTAGFGVSEQDAYPARLERKLNADGYRFRVVNSGVSGETSSGLLSRVNWVLRLRPDIVILETGANDGFRGINTDLIEKNITEAVRILKEHNVTVILAGMEIVRNLGEPYASDFGKIYPKVAGEQGVILIPFFLKGVATDPKLNQPDAIHPTADGYKVVVENLYPYVVEAIKARKEGGARSSRKDS